MAGIDAVKGRLLAVLLALALLPMICIGIISLEQMEKASLDVQNNISSLSTSLNRSALDAGKEDAGQVQLAIAKARQYDEFFKRIASENEVVAGFAAVSSANESCLAPPGMWIAPTGSEQTASQRRETTVNYLCGPAKIMQEQDKARSTSFLSYIGTEDGVLVVWPYSNKTLRNAAPFGYRDMPYYSQAKLKKGTIWTGPYQDSRGDYFITITTPFYRNGEFAGIAGMVVPLYPVYQDLSSMKGRGYPFIIDSSGLIIYRPENKPEGGLNEIFESDSLISSASPKVRSLGRDILKDISGSIVVDLADKDWYVAFSRISEMGWTLCIAYPAEEMSLPARFIDSGVQDVAKKATAGLSDAANRIESYILVIFIMTISCVLALGWFMSSRIDSQIASLSHAAERISQGDFSARAAAWGGLAPIAESINRMAMELGRYAARAEEAAPGDDFGGESAFLEGVKRNLVPAELPRLEGYGIQALYRPSEKSTFDLYDISYVDGRIAFALAGVGGDGVQAAILAIMSRTLISASPHKLDPARAVGDLNVQISRYRHGTNLACFYALLDPANHTLEYVNAGFNPPFIVDAGGMVDTLGGGGIALGMLDQLEMETTAIPIQPGDVMVMYSNGVVEAENEFGKQFGIERLINLVIKNRGRSAPEILAAVEKDLLDYALHAASDLTLIILKRD